MIKKIIPIIILVLLISVFLFKILFFKNIYLIGDSYYYYSIRALISNSLKSFHFPLWTQYLTCGFPLMANPEAGVFDPLNITLLYLFDPVIAFNMLICIYFFMAGLFTFLFCRSIGLDVYSSFFSAIVFIFGGAFAGGFVHITMIFSASFLPLVFWTINLFFKEKKIKFIFLTGLGIGLSFLPGHPQIAVYISFVAILYFLFNALFIENINFKLKKLIKYGTLIVVILIVALGISAIQNFPTKELTNLTGRAKLMRYDDAKTINLNFKHFITYIFPFFFGFPNSVADKVSYWGKGSFWELYIYLGILPFCLLFVIFSRLKDKRVLFFSILALLSLLYALGRNTPVFFIIFYLFPPLRYFKDPCRFVFVSSFAMAILSGISLNLIASDDNLLRKLLRTVIKTFFTILGITVIFNIIFYFGKDFIINGNNKIYLAFKGLSLNDVYVQLPFIFFISLIIILWGKKARKIKRAPFYVLIIFITLIDLFVINFSHNILQSSSIVSLPPQSVSFLKKDKSLFRVYHIGPDFPYGTDKHAEIDKAPFFVIWGIPSANYAGPLRIARYNVLGDMNDINLHKNNISLNLDNFSLFNVKYFTSTIKLKNMQAKAIFDDGIVTIYENPKLTPRIFFVNLSQLNSGYKDILNSETELSLKHSPEKGNFNYNVKIIKYMDKELYLELNNDIPGFLVVSDTFYPGWKVFVDGKKEKIFRVNTIMRAVFVKEGDHRVRFLYDPVSLKLSFSISFISFSIILLLCLTKTGERKII